MNFLHIRVEPRKIILLYEKASHNDNSTKNLHMIQGGSGPYFYEYLHSRIAARNDQPLTNTLTSRLGTSATDSQRRGERVVCSAKREGPVAAIAERFGQDQARRTGDCQLKLCASWHSHNVYRCKNASCMQASLSRIAVTATATATSTESGPAQKAWPFCSRIYTDAADANHDRYPSSPVKRYPFGRRTVGQPVALYATVSKVL